MSRSNTNRINSVFITIRSDQGFQCYTSSSKMKHIFKVVQAAMLAALWLASGYADAKDSTIVRDIDGNVYRTVSIGKQEWIAENLKTTTHNNGKKIPQVTDSSIWVSMNTGAYCRYNNEENCADSMGLLYNWYAVNTGDLCPCGWRVPSDEDWKYLEGYVDSLYHVGNLVWNEKGLRGYDAGTKLKAVFGWRPGGSFSDAFGFSALPGGERLSSFHGFGTSGFWWSSTENDSDSAWYRNIVYSLESVARNTHPKRMGFSVRCVREK